MRSVLYLLTTLVVMGMAFWAYRENYRTQAALQDMTHMQRQIGSLREDLGVLRAEWAFLNRPDRLRELTNMNFDKLKLVPFTSDQFVEVGQVAFPPPKAPAPNLAGTDPALLPIERPAGFPPIRPQERTP
ncbi:cell division protein FtsL [Paracoccus shanxieyensis]|uniref:Cell division protein FtsL n=1 Tax=Paracoccus shanxieyensis TaxID=2675752 RepID=A0A6L6IZC2_9RHOB|nr:cell division protein FtsL [Paracoccus shanxieyensis]MTH64928.1 cell division protein FtsL [Paracoccus shanxieyensis]MTH88168.1 cell division protein FtsL [Paracoccus shanxieyensis]